MLSAHQARTLAPTCSYPSYVALLLPINASKMCSYYRNYYVYSSCLNKAIHYFRTAMDGDRSRSCAKSPHERFIIVVGDCPQCR